MMPMTPLVLYSMITRARGKLLALIAQDRLPSAEHETFGLNGERVHAALLDEQGDSLGM